MEIYVDGKKDRVPFDREIDDEDAIRNFVSSKYNIPWSFIEIRLEDSNFKAVTAGTLFSKSKDLRSEYQKIKERFPKITPLEYGVYHHLKYDDYTENKIYYLELYKSAFSSKEELTKSIASYKEKISTKREAYEKKKVFLESFKKSFAKYESIKGKDLRITTNIFEIDLGDDDEYIFDQLKPSKRMPLIFMVKEKEKTFKLFSGTHYDPSWASIADQPFSDGIYFKMANINTEKLALGHLKTETQYSDGYIRDGIAKIFFNSSFGLGKDYVETFFSPFIKNQATRFTRTIGLDGIFEVEIPFYEKNMWVHLLATNPVLSDMFYCSEVFKSFAMKTRTTFYYDVFNEAKDDSSESIPFTITHKDGDFYNIYIRKARTIQEINVVGSLICRTLSFFQQKQNLYPIREIYSVFGINFSEKTGKKKILTRKGDRVGLLNQLYGGDVSRKCPSKRQPTTIESSEIEKYRAEYGKDTVLETKNYNWVCMDPGAEISDNPFPGFQLDKSRIEERCIPCCFSINQFQKKSSKIGVCRDIESGKGVDTSQKKSGLGYIIETAKDLSEGRYGDTPYFIKKLLERINWPTFKKESSKTYYKFLRHGMPDTNDTIAHCFASAFDPTYRESLDKIGYIRKLRKRLAAKTNLLAYCKQSCYDYDLKDLEDILKDENSEVDPDMFLDLFQEYYNARCYIITMSKKELRGNIFYPRTEGRYISDTRDYENTIVVVRSENVAGLAKCSVLQKVSFDLRATYGPYTLEEMGELGVELKNMLERVFSIAYQTHSV